MKKYINFTLLGGLILIFCGFLFYQNPHQRPPRRAHADVTATELELKEYQELEHGIYTSIPTGELNEQFTKETDTSPSSNYVVVIDAGHGGPDPGSIGYKTKIYEATLNLKISKMLKEKLESAGIKVSMTRETDEALAEGRGKAFKKRDMEMRKEIIKNLRPNMVVSIHQNSFTNHSLHGAQVFYDKTSEISRQIADFIQIEFQKSLTDANKCISPGDYYMLKCTAAPSVIIECGFLSNEKEETLLQDETYQQKIVDAIYFGIVNFLQTK